MSFLLSSSSSVSTAFTILISTGQSVFKLSFNDLLIEKHVENIQIVINNRRQIILPANTFVLTRLLISFVVNTLIPLKYDFLRSFATKIKNPESDQKIKKVDTIPFAICVKNCCSVVILEASAVTIQYAWLSTTTATEKTMRQIQGFFTALFSFLFSAFNKRIKRDLPTTNRSRASTSAYITKK